MTASAAEQSILRTLAYFDVFDYPLTAEELPRWLYPPRAAASPQSGDVPAALESLVRDGRVGRQGTYYYLAGRESTVQSRTDRFMVSQKKWRRAITAAQWLEMVPYVRLVAVVNTLAIDNARDSSDIDYLIVTDRGHIWITRLMVTGLISMLGYRRHSTKIKNRICLSFYVTTDALDLRELRAEDDDHHFAFWTAQAVPLFDAGVYEKFREANAWVSDRLPQAWDPSWRDRLVRRDSFRRSIRRFYELFLATPFGPMVETWARTSQLDRMSKNTQSKSSEPSTDVVISEDVLKFHEADRRREYNKAFRDRLRSLDIPE